MVALSGGLHGVKDLNLLELAVGRPQMSVGFQDAYQAFLIKPEQCFTRLLQSPFFDETKELTISAVYF